jgi:hypothetical protein
MEKNEYKSLNQIPDLPAKSPLKIPNRDRIALFKPRPKEPVVDGDIKWKPIDQVAARVVQKASWFHLPPELDPVFEKKQKMSIQFPERGRVKAVRKLSDRGFVEEFLNINEVAPFAIMEHEEKVREGIKSGADLVARAHDVVDACDYLVDHIKEPFGEYQSWVKKELQSTREHRIALESETRQLMAALKEVRAFFIDKDYELERARLAEFISLCERLRALKESGFLDTVAETMLNLATGAYPRGVRR